MKLRQTLNEKMRTGVMVHFSEIDLPKGRKAVMITDDNGKKYIIADSLVNFIKWKNNIGEREQADIQIVKDGPIARKVQTNSGSLLSVNISTKRYLDKEDVKSQEQKINPTKEPGQETVY